MQSGDAKEETFRRVLASALTLDAKLGHLRWSVSQLSEASGVSRSRIYYYFRGAKATILLEAVRLLGKEVGGLTPAQLRHWDRLEIAESVIQARRLLSRFPSLVGFYYSHRGDPTPVGAAIRKIESEHLEKVRRHFHGFPESSLQAVAGALIGLSFSLHLSEEAVREGVALLTRALGPARPRPQAGASD
jgi:AcrR family transcriptional regulator